MKNRALISVFALWFTAGLLIAAGIDVTRLRWHQRQRPETAIDKMTISSKKGKRDPRLDRVMQRTEAYLKVERFNDAFLELQEASKLAPLDPRPWHGFGQVYHNLTLMGLAEQSYRKALALDPGFHVAKLDLSRLLCEVGKNQEAIGYLESLKERYPRDPRLWAAMAENAMRLGKPEEAVMRLKRYNEIQGTSGWGLMKIGRAHAETGDVLAAEEALRASLELSSKLDLAHLWLGQLLVSLNRADEAEELFEEFARLRQLKDRRRHLEDKVMRQPDNVDALVALAQVRHQLGLTRQALVPLKRAQALQPTNQRLQLLSQRFKASAKGEASH